MLYNTHRYYQVLKSFIYATKSLLMEFRNMEVDLISYGRDMMMENPEYYAQYLWQQEQQQSTTNGGDE